MTSIEAAYGGARVKRQTGPNPVEPILQGPVDYSTLVAQFHGHPYASEPSQLILSRGHFYETRF